MKYAEIGKAGLKVSRFCLGTMTFGDPVEIDDAVRLVHQALDAGVNFIDTANTYEGYRREIGTPGGVAEEILGKALIGRREHVVLVTKVGNAVGDKPEDRGLSRRHVVRECDKSLKRLKTDFIDLYYLHRPDPDTDIDTTLSVIEELRQAGKIRHFGVSNYNSTQLREIFRHCDLLGIPQPVCNQPLYNMLQRDIELEELPLCRKYGLGVTPFSPLHGGWLSGKYKRNRTAPLDSRAIENPKWLQVPDEACFDILEQLADIATEQGISMSQLALSWLLTRESVLAPIVGVKGTEQLAENIAGVDVDLDAATLERIDRILECSG